jgi:hypothetical protein
MRASTVLTHNDVIDMKGYKRHLILLDTAVFTPMVGTLSDQRAEGVIRHCKQEWRVLWLAEQQ